MVALSDGLALVRSDARWSLRGRLVASEITDMASRYERRGIRLYAAALLFGEALGNALRKKETEPPAWLMESPANCHCQLLDGAGAGAASYSAYPERSALRMARMCAPAGRGSRHIAAFPEFRPAR